jgi:thiopeptide-type bacteriocin biosynthesis protein
MASEMVITHVGDARWSSYHLVYPGDLDALLLQVVRPVVNELWADGIIDRFFFIRYPEGGNHVRLRLRIASGVETRLFEGRAYALLDGRCAGFCESLAPDGALVPQIDIVPAPFELEVERYGGPQFFPHALSFFSLSSMNALRFVEQWRHETRARQLMEILTHLGRHALGFARTVAELRNLSDYVLHWRSRMAVIVARADRTFEDRAQDFTDRLRQVFESAANVSAGDLVPGTPRAQVAYARSLTAAVRGLEGEERWQATGSQMHMAANRLGLSNAEEVYLSVLLCRCLDALGDELADLSFAAAACEVPVPRSPALTQGGTADAAGQALDALIASGMRALLAGDLASAPGVDQEGTP